MCFRWPRPAVYVVLALLLCWVGPVRSGHAQSSGGQVPSPYILGADVSFLRAAEQQGVEFREGDRVRPALDLFRAHGYTWVRLRLFHSPADLPNDLPYTLALARDAKARGFKLLLDLHYADTWADPTHQPPPAAWRGLPLEALADSVFGYTRRTIASFRRAGVLPEMVQVGNEVGNGMLWPTGRLPDNWAAFVRLVQAGIAGVEAGAERGRRPRILVHYQQGGDPGGAHRFFDRLRAHGVAYDVIGLSYYPWWHGSLLHLRATLLALVEAFDNDILLVETAYAWHPAEYPEGAAPFPETPLGQRDYLATLHQMLMSISSRQVRGLFWWEPAVPPGPFRARGFFDDEGTALPALRVFDAYTRGVVGAPAGATSSGP